MKIFIATIGPYPDALHRALITREEKTKAQRDLATLKAGPDKIDPMFNIKGDDENEKETCQPRSRMEQRILISEEDLGHEVKSIKSRWQRTIITKWFLRHVLPSRIDPQTKRTTILKLKGFIRGLKIPNIDTGKLQTVRKCLHNRSKGLLGSRAVTNFLPLRTTGKKGKNDKIITNGLGL